MSNSPNDNSFEAMSWQAGKTGKRANRSGFGEIDPGKKAPADSRGFVSPYVSKEKLREINAEERRRQGLVPNEEEIEKRAYEKGFAQGEAAGLAAGQQQAQALVNQMQSILTDMQTMWQQLLTTYEKQIIDLVCRVAEQVVYGKVEIDQEIVKNVILNAFSVIPEPVGVTIEVNPKDYEYIDTVKEDFFTQIASLKDVSVSPDPAVSRGGCHIRSRSGDVDASLETRLDAIRKTLVEANGRNS